jgi:hypothetical protein
MGITLLRSGSKPGTKDKAYRLLFSDRMAIDEVEDFIARNSGGAKVTAATKIVPDRPGHIGPVSFQISAGTASPPLFQKGAPDLTHRFLCP